MCRFYRLSQGLSHFAVWREPRVIASGGVGARHRPPRGGWDGRSGPPVCYKGNITWGEITNSQTSFRGGLFLHSFGGSEKKMGGIGIFRWSYIRSFGLKKKTCKRCCERKGIHHHVLFITARFGSYKKKWDFTDPCFNPTKQNGFSRGVIDHRPLRRYSIRKCG